MLPVKKFKPPFYLRNRHLQTILGPLTRPSSAHENSVKWEVSKNGVTMQGWFTKHPTSPHVIAIFHGLGGHVESSYVTGISKMLSRHYSTLRVGLRGSDDDTSQTYHAAMTDDIGLVVQSLQQQNFRVSLVGFSLSAVMILKWLEESKRDVECAFVVSPPVNLGEAAKRLDEGRNRMYQKYFLRKLGRLLRRKKEKNSAAFSELVGPQTFSSIRGFDTHFTAKKNGFSSAEEYYSIASPKNLEKIQNKICIIHSKDDPFIGHSDLEKLDALKNPNLQVHLTNYGGHVGFYGGRSQGYMVDQWAQHYFAETLLSNS